MYKRLVKKVKNWFASFSLLFTKRVLQPGWDLAEKKRKTKTRNFEYTPIPWGPYWAFSMKFDEREWRKKQLKGLKKDLDLSGMLITLCPECDEHHVSKRLIPQCKFCGSSRLLVREDVVYDSPLSTEP